MTRRKKPFTKTVHRSLEKHFGKPVRKEPVRLSNLTNSVYRLIFASLYRDRDTGKASCLLDIAELTTTFGIKRLKTGVFVIGSNTHHWLAEGLYRHWFLDLGDEFVEVINPSLNVLYDKLNILVVKPSEAQMKREIEYTDIVV